MNGERFVPGFDVVLDGQPAPAALRSSITGVSWETGLEGADRVELTIANEGLRWLDHPLLALDTSLELSVGYHPAPLERVFLGEVVTADASFPGAGIPTLTIAAQDHENRLKEGTKARWFAIPITSVGNIPLPDMTIGSIISLENGLLPAYEPVGAAISVLLGGAEAVAAADSLHRLQKLIRKQADESDFDFLKKVAAENGWEVFVDHEGPTGGYTLRFLSPLDHLDADIKLGWGRDLLDFTPRVTNVGKLVSITVHVWVSQLKTRFAVTVGFDWDRMALTIDIRPGLALTQKGGSKVLVDEVMTPALAPRKLLAELLPKLNGRLTASGSTVGDIRFRPGVVVRIDDIGEQFGGHWRVTAATHRFDAGGWRTSFQARKEIWFASIPAPAQGAVPVAVTPLPV